MTFVFGSGRFVPAQAIMTLAVPSSRRGAFMSLSGCARDLAMALTSSLGGWIVTRAPTGELVHFQWLGWLPDIGPALETVNRIIRIGPLPKGMVPRIEIDCRL